MSAEQQGLRMIIRHYRTPTGEEYQPINVKWYTECRCPVCWHLVNETDSYCCNCGQRFITVEGDDSHE